MVSEQLSCHENHLPGDASRTEHFSAKENEEGARVYNAKFGSARIAISPRFPRSGQHRPARARSFRPPLIQQCLTLAERKVEDHRGGCGQHEVVRSTGLGSSVADGKLRLREPIVDVPASQ